MMVSKVNIAELFARFNEPWSPKVAGDINDMQVKMVKLRGEFVWHHHEREDELFLVVRGQLRMRFRDGEVLLNPGEFIIVPHGVEHFRRRVRGDSPRTSDDPEHRQRAERAHRGPSGAACLTRNVRRRPRRTWRASYFKWQSDGCERLRLS